MPDRKNDRRINRTRRHLREALLALILEKGYDAVTIEDVTNRADLGRTTFYLHYRDKEELLLESIETIASDLKEQIGISNISPDMVQMNENRIGLIAVSRVFYHASEHSDLYRIILNGGAAKQVQDTIRDIITETAMEFLQQRMRNEKSLVPAVPLEIVASYLASSLLGLLTWWLEKGMTYSPQQMAEYYLSLFFAGSIKSLGVEGKNKSK